ncbi:MAG: hypothetical protein A2Z08_00150 [Deltaproteobacteria bacterium RBG_16_54_11]|nr:MAG: hypothetical protein A2Z08_00150 [Deltaproteobacteria bacterium RBG_16_54_11]
MWKTLQVLCVVALLMASSVAFAVDYPYKKIDDFKTLESFKSIDEFEASYNKYIQHCRENTGGGTGGVPCLIGYEMWDGELNIYYSKLMKILGEKEKKLLKESQLAWIKERDATIAFNSRLLDKKYTEEGTMYVLMRAGDADRMMTPVVKQRALLLKEWLELVSKLEKHK